MLYTPSLFMEGLSLRPISTSDPVMQPPRSSLPSLSFSAPSQTTSQLNRNVIFRAIALLVFPRPYFLCSTTTDCLCMLMPRSASVPFSLSPSSPPFSFLFFPSLSASSPYPPLLLCLPLPTPTILRCVLVRFSAPWSNGRRSDSSVRLRPPLCLQSFTSL